MGFEKALKEKCYLNEIISASLQNNYSLTQKILRRPPPALFARDRQCGIASSFWLCKFLSPTQIPEFREKLKLLGCYKKTGSLWLGLTPTLFVTLIHFTDRTREAQSIYSFFRPNVAEGLFKAGGRLSEHRPEGCLWQLRVTRQWR